jgi:hypothetical protein
MLPVIIKDSALDDIQKAYDYLEKQEKDLGEKLLKSLQNMWKSWKPTPTFLRLVTDR